MLRTALLLAAGVLLAQTTLPPSLEIASPAADAYISGTTILRATLSEPDVVARVVFSVDGRQICDAPTPPFECSWEAGPNGGVRSEEQTSELQSRFGISYAVFCL